MEYDGDPYQRCRINHRSFVCMIFYGTVIFCEKKPKSPKGFCLSISDPNSTRAFCYHDPPKRTTIHHEQLKPTTTHHYPPRPAKTHHDPLKLTTTPRATKTHHDQPRQTKAYHEPLKPITTHHYPPLSTTTN